MNHFQPPDVILIHSSPEPEFIDLTILDDADDADDLNIQFIPGLPPPRPAAFVPQTTSIVTLPTPPPSLNIPTHTQTPPVPQWQSLLPGRENSESTEPFTRSNSQTASRATTVSSQAPVVPLKKKRGRPPRKAVELKDTKDPREHAVSRTLEPYLLAARAENTQTVKNALKAGRLTAKKELLRRQGESGGIIMDDEDPFEGMKSVECFHSVAKTDFMVFNPEINAGDGKKLYLASKRIVMPTNLPEVPPYRAMTTLRTNIMTPDDPVLHYVPYYGESSEEQEEEKDDYATLFSRNGVRIAEKDEGMPII
ncbi:hypothetical protein EX30DRAFT_235601 [Ascodesmis nigricans]|uniref:Uncharacterized protein n=1 Tax=Ascodesmis nigricans TaxID=341454 RepID=A0A4S2MYU4_9PEZI|nr:hypothetical protein EX30DRAFT_235601 [Ascodesmis nigricans]